MLMQKEEVILLLHKVTSLHNAVVENCLFDMGQRLQSAVGREVKEKSGSGEIK